MSTAHRTHTVHCAGLIVAGEAEIYTPCLAELTIFCEECCLHRLGHRAGLWQRAGLPRRLASHQLQRLLEAGTDLQGGSVGQ